MKRVFRSTLMTAAAAAVCGLGGSWSLAYGQEAPEEEESVQSTIIVTGARGAGRLIEDSPVAIDVFNQEAVEQVSFTDTNDVLRTLVPSFSVNRQPISDGASFIRPAELRGLPTDKTLVLVNSKRRHRAALVGIGGAGSQGPDLATIPASAIKTVEVLRDGAAAQYGSDAIAGVLNFILKDDTEGFTLTTQTGQYYEGDGFEYLIAGNWGLPLGDTGFINISAEHTYTEGTVRAEQYCESFACVDPNSDQHEYLTGIDQSLAGFDIDTYEAGLDDANIGDGDVVQPWGAPPATATRFFVNAGYEFANGIEAYGFANYSDSESDGSFFYRYPGNGTIEDIRLEDGSVWSPLEIYPGGFTPRFTGEVTDYSFVGGLKGELSNGLTWDVSGRYGYNEIQYTLENTINPSLGPDSPTTFRPGDLINEETQFQADFTQEFNIGTFSPLIVAFGASYLDESYEIVEGQEESYIAGPYAVQDPWDLCEGNTADGFTGDPTAAGAAVIADGSTLDCSNDDDPVFRTVGVGSNGFPGYGPDVAGTESRDSIGAYVDFSTDVTEDLLVQVAGRYEDYSDFGEEVVGKLAAQYDLTDNFSVRGSISNGFRAPTVGQQSTTNVSTRLPNGVPVATGLFPATSAAAEALGARPLEPETSTNYTLGFTGDAAGITFAIDFYRIDLKDRINAVSTIEIINDIDDPSLNTGPAPDGEEYASVLDAAGVPNANTIGGVNFFQNAFDTITEGVDVVLTYTYDWQSAQSTDFQLAFNYNTTEFDGGVGVDLEGEPYLNAEEEFDFENGDPEWRATFTANHSVGDFTILGRANLYGSYENSDSGGAEGEIQEFGEEVLFDLELGYQLTEQVRLTLGARNIFDEYPDEGDDRISDTCCGRIYRSDSVVDWQGGFYYLRAVADF